MCWSCVPSVHCASGYVHLCAYLDYRFDPPLVLPIERTCQTVEQCEGEDDEEPPGEGGGPPPTPPVPCIPDPPGVICEGWRENWDCSLYVAARVPPHLVQVDPFPRWLTAMGAPLPSPYESGEEGHLILQDYPAFTPPGLCTPNGPGFSEGCWSNTCDFPEREEGEEPQAGDIRTYKLGLRWRRVRVDIPNPLDLGIPPPTCWTFGEREWNVGADYGYGPIPNEVCGPTDVTHIYETSSWDLPHNGPRFIPEAAGCEKVPSDDGEWDMPAYQVQVYTTWQVEWKVEWEQYELVGDEWGECGCSGVDPRGSPDWRSCGDPPPGICVGVYEDPPTEWWGQWAEGTYEWVAYEIGWEPIDLRAYGNGTWYYTSWAVITTGAGPWCAFEYADPNPGDTVRVPVIEVQSVLRDPCILDGTCPPGYPR